MRKRDRRERRGRAMSAPMRVAQVLGRMDSGGIEAVVCNYYRHVDRTRVQFDFYFDEGSRLPQREALVSLGAGLYPTAPYTRPLAYCAALRRAFSERGYGVVHVHLNTMSVFALYAAWRAGVPVRICHNHTTAHWAEGPRTLLKLLLRPWSRLFATELFACADHAGRWMYGSRPFTVMPNAIEAEKYAYDGAARQRLRRALGVSEDALLVGHVGRFMPQKNHAFLLEVFASLARMRPTAQLLLVGEGPLEADVRRRAAALGLADRVIFTGARQDVNELYSAMDVFCLPSLYEGLGMVAVEAQANGLPCVCSAEVPREADVTGSVCFLPRKDPSVWAEQLLQARRRSGGVTQERYDIRHAAAWLTEQYETWGDPR